VETDLGSICLTSSPFISSSFPRCGGDLEDPSDFELAAAQEFGLEDDVEVHILQNSSDALIDFDTDRPCTDPVPTPSPSMTESCLDMELQNTCPAGPPNGIEVSGVRLGAAFSQTQLEVGAATVEVIFAPRPPEGIRDSATSPLSAEIVATYPINV